MATINLSWTPPSEANGGSATSYKIWRKQGTHSSGSTIGNAPDSGWPKTKTHSGGTTASQTYADSSAVFGTIYSYTVKGNNAAGDSANFSSPDNAQA
jgi:hypothetical protein